MDREEKDNGLSQKLRNTTNIRPRVRYPCRIRHWCTWAKTPHPHQHKSQVWVGCLRELQLHKHKLAISPRLSHVGLSFGRAYRLTGTILLPVFCPPSGSGASTFLPPHPPCKAGKSRTHHSVPPTPCRRSPPARASPAAVSSTTFPTSRH